MFHFINKTAQVSDKISTDNPKEYDLEGSSTINYHFTSQKLSAFHSAVCPGTHLKLNEV